MRVFTSILHIFLMIITNNRIITLEIKQLLMEIYQNI